ncbi:carbohydrate ABC transporter permease [Arenibaculum pallidiluteum]|uniref:carbohydrate ABC transporter permease n=1 Tax=Arenibaculum pallidiluteum TaxID=2812559 RepID=UPI001A95640F|nr:sugar ABC transporter permease [Arenibaculum pallidiluteum]
MATTVDPLPAEGPTEDPMGAAGPRPGRMRLSPAVWFLAPAVLALAAVGIYPLGVAVVNSLHRYNLARPNAPTPFVGLDNYVAVLSDPSFWGAVGRTFAFLALVLPAELALGVLFALALHRPGLGLMRALTRVALVIPIATTYAVVGLIGRLIFNRQFGVANQALSWVGLPPVDWLGDPTLAFVAIAIMDVWQWTPFCALILLAGLTMVPRETEEAARLETTSAWSIFRHLQLPYLLPGITAILILRTADVLKLFDAVFVMTRGGPGTATELISIYVQRVAFRVFDQGLASAQAVILLVITIVLSRLYIKFVYREV